MLAYYISTSITVISSIALSIFIALKAKKSKTNNSLILFNLSLAIWSLFLLLHFLSKSYTNALLTARLLHIGAIFIPSCYLNFIAHFLGVERKNRKIIRTSFAVSTLFLLVSFTPLFMKNVSPKLFFKFYSDAGSLYIYWIATFILIIEDK